jgi:hypothetical protein
MLTFILALLVMCLRTVLGDVFLQRSEFGNELNDEHILVQLERAMGSEHRAATETRMKSITEALSSIFVALPKNSTGKVGSSSARYALHRLFVQRHGWQVKGLAADGETWDAAQPSAALPDKVSSGVKKLFDDRLGSSGLSLDELAVFAATLENFIHAEAMTRLQSAYQLSGEEPMQTLEKKKVDKVFQAYMAIYVMGINTTATSKTTMRRHVKNVGKIYPGWDLTLKFLDDLRREVVGDRPSYDFTDITDVVEEAGERFGRFQNQECLDLKQTLVRLEEFNGSGRVRLADFYNSALSGGQWQFSESLEYLRQLGALDESDSSNLRVIIPNYLNAPSNCIASSAYYGVCCIDECEELLGHVETELKSPMADSGRIAKIIANLPSSSLAAGRELSATQMQRLKELGDYHGNNIPIHGRLFAQWMHLAYPRECPFPHLSGTIRPKTSKDRQEDGETTRVQKDEMQKYISAGRHVTLKQQESCNNEICSAMWSTEEELVDAHAHSLEQARKAARGAWRTTLFSIFAFAAAVSFAVATLKDSGKILGTVEVSSKPWRTRAAQSWLKPTLNLHNV